MPVSFVQSPDMQNIQYGFFSSITILMNGYVWMIGYKNIKRFIYKFKLTYYGQIPSGTFLFMVLFIIGSKN